MSVHHCRGDIFLRHELRHQQFQDGVRIFEGRRDAFFVDMAQSQRTRGSGERRVAVCIDLLHHGTYVPRKFGGISCHGFHRNDRTVHRIRTANFLPSEFVEKELRSGTIQPRKTWNMDRMGSCSVGDDHHRPLLPPRHVSRHQRHSQLHSCRSWRRLHPCSLFMDLHSQILVQGTHN